MWWRRTGRKLLRSHELAVIDAVLAAIPPEAAELIEHQLATRSTVSRIIDDSDVMLYGPSRSEPDPTLAFPNRSPDLRLATVRLRGSRGNGRATVRAVHGWMFMIEFRPAPKRIGVSSEIEALGVTVHADPMASDGGRSPLLELAVDVRAEIEEALARDLVWAAMLAAPGDMYQITLDDGVFMVLAQLADTDFVVARVDPPGPGIRRYEADGELVGEFGTLREALQDTLAT